MKIAFLGVSPPIYPNSSVRFPSLRRSTDRKQHAKYTIRMKRSHSNIEVQTADGGRLEVTVCEGPDSNRAALFLHDFMTDSRIFTPLFSKLDVPSYKLIAPSFRGFGGSSDPVSAYSHIDDMDAILENLGVDRVHVVGTGMGGILALEYAIARRDKTRSVALFNSGLPGHQWSENDFFDVSEAQYAGMLHAKGVKHMFEGNEELDVMHWKRKFIAFNQTWHVPLRSGSKQVAKWLLSMAKTYNGFHFFLEDPVVPNVVDVEPLCDRLGDVKVPVLVAVGEEDTDDFRKIATEIAVGVKTEVAVIEDARHFAVLERPDNVAEQLSRFWTGQEREAEL